MFSTQKPPIKVTRYGVQYGVQNISSNSVGKNGVNILQQLNLVSSRPNFEVTSVGSFHKLTPKLSKLFPILMVKLCAII